jgi:deferrochelatase/peroxidase EfeB
LIGSSGVTRREALSGAVLLGVGGGLSHIVTGGWKDGPEATTSGRANSIVPFYGRHQAGIATPTQDYLYFASFDVTTSARDDLQIMLQQWTSAAASLTDGMPYRGPRDDLSQPPVETGEAIGLGAARLTLTFGFGPTLFGMRDSDRFGLARRRPPELEDLQAFRGDSLEGSRSAGDICVQACADDPQVAFHAVHVLSRIAQGTAVLRWAQPGFGRTSSTTRAQETPRNLMGFKDGTDNIRVEETDAMDNCVWVKDTDAPDWMINGSYLVVRRIRILFDVWDTTSLEGQQRVIGREKLTGAPLGQRHEYDPVDLSITTTGGEPAIPADAHIRLAHPQTNGGERILRRGYSYNEGIEPGTGEIDAGLFFVAFQRSPKRQFVPLQRRLAANDALNRHTVHVASAVFACPPGLRSGGFLGETILS